MVSLFLRPLADSEKLPVQRHRNVETLKSPDSEAPLAEKKSKKPKKKEKKHKEKERDKGKKKEKEKKVVEEEEEEEKKVILQDLHYFRNCHMAHKYGPYLLLCVLLRNSQI